MNKILHITNGSSAVDIMQKSGLQGDFLPWNEVLHVGPVPTKLSFEALSEVRAKYIITQGWADADRVDRLFRERAVVMNNIYKYEKVTLWFEHDLYDQLQILEILHWFTTHPYNGELTMVCTENYLGRCSVEEMKCLIKFEEEVTQAQLDLSVKAWDAFRVPDPLRWAGLLKEDTSALPFLKGAVLRILQEYPFCDNGLSKTQQDILENLAQGEKDLVSLFLEQQEREERVFMADTVFADTLNEMLQSDVPLLNASNGKSFTFPFTKKVSVKITEEGLSVLSDGKEWRESQCIDKWIGGVHLSEHNLWCWNEEEMKVEKQQ